MTQANDMLTPSQNSSRFGKEVSSVPFGTHAKRLLVSLRRCPPLQIGTRPVSSREGVFNRRNREFGREKSRFSLTSAQKIARLFLSRKKHTSHHHTIPVTLHTSRRAAPHRLRDKPCVLCACGAYPHDLTRSLKSQRFVRLPISSRLSILAVTQTKQRLCL